MSTTEAHDAGVRRAIDRVRRKADDLIAAIIDLDHALSDDEPLPVADDVLSVERMVTADSMEPGGWVRWPGSPRWFPVDSVGDRPGDDGRVVHYRATNGDVIGRWVAAADTFPYLTAAEMEQPQRCGGLVADGICALDYGHAGRCMGAGEAMGEVA